MRSTAVKYSRTAICIVVAFVVAFFPFNVNLINGIHIEKNKACASASVFGGAYDFLNVMSQAAGFEDAGDFVASIAGITTVATGTVIAGSSKIVFGSDLTSNLDALIDAANYPSWDTLSSSEKSAWGSKDNYDSAKFDSLMAAYGMGDAYNRYQNAWGNAGETGFSFSAQEQNNLDKIFNIGSRWAEGLSNTVSDITSGNWINSQTVKSWAPLEQMKFEASLNDNNWPANLTRTIYYIVDTEYLYEYMYRNNRQTINYEYSIPVNIFSWQNGTFTYFLAFSKTSFQAKNRNSSNWNNCSTVNYNNETIYYDQTTGYNSGDILTNSVPSIGTYSWNNVSDQNYVMYSILFGDSEKIDNEIEDYPSEDIQNGDLDDVAIYFPIEGIDENSQWDDLLTGQEEIIEGLEGVITLLRHIDSDLHKFTFTTTGDLKVFDTTNNLVLQQIRDLITGFKQIFSTDGADQIIGDFDFDDIADKVPNLLETIEQVAPFGALLLLSDVYTILSEVASIEDPSFEVPFKFGGLDDNATVEIDLSWLDGIKPVINFVCILMLILALARSTMAFIELEAAS